MIGNVTEGAEHFLTFQGIRYGTILTQHFGIETDFDLDTTHKLRRLKVLLDSDLADLFD